MSDYIRTVIRNILHGQDATGTSIGPFMESQLRNVFYFVRLRPKMKSKAKISLTSKTNKLCYRKKIIFKFPRVKI